MSAKLLFLLFLLPLLLSHQLTVSGRRTRTPKLTRIRFFWHDTAAGPDPSALIVAQPATIIKSGFGIMKVMDDPLTVGPNRSSLQIGKSQGTYIFSDKQTPGLLMAMTLSFVVGKYNGSTLTVVGRNLVLTEVREMAITGGTGVFRFATGYVQARTHSYDPTFHYYVVEYNCYFAIIISPSKSEKAEISTFI